MNPEHYSIRQPGFWQQYFDRLSRYFGITHTALIKQVRFNTDGEIEFTCTNASSLTGLLNNLFQAFERDSKLVIPNYQIDNYNSSKSLWLFIPHLFNVEENKVIFESWVRFYYDRVFPRQFTAQFLKYLNGIVELSGIVRRAGVQEVRFELEGVKFIWPIYYLPNETSTEILSCGIPGISFIRDESLRIETLTVGYEFAWAAASGTAWSGDLKELFESNETFKAIGARINRVDPDDFSYCLDMVKALMTETVRN